MGFVWLPSMRSHWSTCEMPGKN